MAAERSPFTLLVGLEILDEVLYSQYREHMMPHLHAHGGAFGYDLVIGKVLKTPALPHRTIHRIFTIHFPDRSAHDRFFADPRYLKVRSEYFEPAVRAVVLTGEWTQALSLVEEG